MFMSIFAILAPINDWIGFSIMVIGVAMWSLGLAKELL